MTTELFPLLFLPPFAFAFAAADLQGRESVGLSLDLTAFHTAL
jgi:hypothetical protein